MTVVVELTDPAVIEKLVELDPAGTVTEDGIFRPAGDAVKEIAAPSLGAADVRLTVQVAVADWLRDIGLQESPFKPGWIVTVPPVVDVFKDFPAASAAELFVICTAEEVCVVEPDTVNVTVATTPFENAVVFRPHNMHVVEPAPPPQERVLFAPVDAGPATTVAAEKSAVG